MVTADARRKRTGARKGERGIGFRGSYRSASGKQHWKKEKTCRGARGERGGGDADIQVIFFRQAGLNFFFGSHRRLRGTPSKSGAGGVERGGKLGVRPPDRWEQARVRRRKSAHDEKTQKKAEKKMKKETHKEIKVV